MENKGFIKLNLKTFIEVVVGLLIIFVLIIATNATGFAAGSFATTGSAGKIAEAINRVSICMDDYGDITLADCKEVVNISLPQNVKDDDGQDPLWAIYHDTKLNAIAAITTEDDFWDWQELNPDKCENDICFGLIEMKYPGKATVEREAIERLDPFWMIDPCYATIRIYSENGRIKICYVGGPDTRKGPGCCNFCYNGDPAYDSGKHGESIWPWTSNSDAWEPPPEGLLCS